MRIELLRETDSTNNYIKRYLPAQENVIVCAERQTGGKGTKGRSFLSEEGGVYFSALTFYNCLPASEAFRIMAHAAVAVCRTAAGFGVNSEIKWPNDVLVSGKKLCGILVENGISKGCVDYSIVGIGVNVHNSLAGLEEIAVTLAQAAGRALTVEEVRVALIREYQRESTFAEYLSFVRFLGEPVRVLEGERAYDATARRILPDGRLEIEREGERHILSAAEISLRI